MHRERLKERGFRIGRVVSVGAAVGVLLAFLAAASLASVRAITRSDATSVATAISIRHSDLPTLKQVSNPITPQELRLDAQAIKCGGAVPLSEAYANTQSAEFVSLGTPSVTVVSSAEILPSATLVAKDFAAVERPRALSCLVSEFSSALRASLPKGDALTAASAARLPSVVAGSGATVDIRVTCAVAVRNGASTVSVPVYVDQIGFSDGQAEVTLEVQTAAVKPSTALERRLAGLLVARARAAIG
ncbi:MAG: hypothetical protein ABSG64_10810 [Solirubrobacteraceae bacterium]